jgi:hypothetical protein
MNTYKINYVINANNDDDDEDYDLTIDDMLDLITSVA